MSSMMPLVINNLEVILAAILFHGFTFVWILIFQCANKGKQQPEGRPQGSAMQPPSSSAGVSAVPPRPGVSEACTGASQVSGVPPGPSSFVQNTNNQSTMPATSNMTQTQKTVTQASQAISSKKSTIADDGGYDNLNPSSKPIESVK